jgi:hypothetical protein
MEFLELFFIYFSKFYIHFYGDKNDNWAILPKVIISTLILINLEIISFYFIKMDNLYIVVLYLIILLFTIFIYRNITYAYVVNYKISRQQKILISFFIILDFVLCFIFLNISRNGNLTI